MENNTFNSFQNVGIILSTLGGKNKFGQNTNARQIPQNSKIKLHCMRRGNMGIDN